MVTVCGMTSFCYLALWAEKILKLNVFLCNLLYLAAVAEIINPVYQALADGNPNNVEQRPVATDVHHYTAVAVNNSQGGHSISVTTGRYES